MAYHVLLQETDRTWTPFEDFPTLAAAEAYAQRKGINYVIETIQLGGKIITVARGTTGRFVQRRKRRAA